MGAAGRDFHNFNLFFRDNRDYEIVAFTATQIPNIIDRRYPPDIAGELYPNGIPIYDEKELSSIITDQNIDEVVFSYSDISYNDIMHKASAVQAAGADFRIMGTKHTMIKSSLPVIAVCAVRTGCGKSAVSIKACEVLKKIGKKVVAIRHPMPYGNLSMQRTQRFACLEDLTAHNCTFEEMEEYEPHIEQNTIIYAGVDYGDILRKAEKEADVILWDGGNNDMPFYQPDLFITLVDPHRAGDELAFYPGETNLKLADVVIITKEDSSTLENIAKVKENLNKINPAATVIDSSLEISVDNKEVINGKRVLAVEDGPSVTHGGMPYGAATIAAQRFGASSIIDPRPYTAGSIAETFKKYPDIPNLLPAMGYGDKQIAELEKTINNADCDLVIVGTPIDLCKKISINKPSVRVKYSFKENSNPGLEEILIEFIKLVR